LSGAAPEPIATDWPVLVTGAGGFVGGHIARNLASAGHRVRAVVRSLPLVEPGDPPIEWVVGDLRDSNVLTTAVKDMRGVIHAASRVHLGYDPGRLCQAINVEVTRALLDEAGKAGVERFVYTSTLHTLAMGTADQPADENTPWNLEQVDSPYAETKRAAEQLVLQASSHRLSTIALCPGMVVGPRDLKPTSTSVLLLMAGPYLDYREMARLVARISGRPRRILTLPNILEKPSAILAGIIDRIMAGRRIDVSSAAVAGGFVPLHVSGRRADSTFGLNHPPAIVSIYDALEAARRSGLGPELSLIEPPESAWVDRQRLLT
jgi:dihydroflavonol-4-reductase